ncbi:MAG: QueT transporter family protein [Clostridia bacterium]|nr:QueT transporter family protein [Clostridia bacterium]
MTDRIRRAARAGLIAALYAAVTLALAPVSFGPLQFRAAEALTTLPILFPEAIPGLFVGCLVANLLGGLGPWDVFGGSAVTLLAAVVTYRFRRSFLAFLSPVLLNGLLVSAYLAPLFHLPYLQTALALTGSEATVVFLLGYPLIQVLRRSGLGGSAL